MIITVSSRTLLNNNNINNLLYYYFLTVYIYALSANVCFVSKTIRTSSKPTIDRRPLWSSATLSFSDLLRHDSTSVGTMISSTNRHLIFNVSIIIKRNCITYLRCKTQLSFIAVPFNTIFFIRNKTEDVSVLHRTFHIIAMGYIFNLLIYAVTNVSF